MTDTQTKTRKISKYEVCGRHAGWFAGETRRRTLETFVEGGPSGMAGCADGKCRLWPGTDVYVAEICDGTELELDWTEA